MTRTYVENRVRFNWGYWDGAAEYERDVPNRCLALDSHPESSYRQGYLIGYTDRACGHTAPTSETAWHWALSQRYVTDDRA